MKTKLTFVALVLTSLLAPSAFAKAPLQVDFNKMIDETSLDRAELNQTAAPESTEQAEATTKNRRKVIDFIDLEISVGAESGASVVDRN